MKKYTKEQILIAGKIGEVSMIDVRHVVSLLDEAVILEREQKLRKHNVSGQVFCTCIVSKVSDSEFPIYCNNCNAYVQKTLR
jgi:hypothetical protein